MMQTLNVVPEIERLIDITEFVEQALETVEAPLKVITQIDVVLDEVFSNIAQYSQATNVMVQCDVQPQFIQLRFLDNGVAYDPTQKENPDVSLSAEERQIGGLGIFLIRKLMNTLEYDYEDGLNCLTLTKSW